MTLAILLVLYAAAAGAVIHAAVSSWADEDLGPDGESARGRE